MLPLQAQSKRNRPRTQAIRGKRYLIQIDTRCKSKPVKMSVTRMRSSLVKHAMQSSFLKGKKRKESTSSYVMKT